MIYWLISISHWYLTPVKSKIREISELFYSQIYPLNIEISKQWSAQSLHKLVCHNLAILFLRGSDTFGQHYWSISFLIFSFGRQLIINLLRMLKRLELARRRDSWSWTKGSWRLGTWMHSSEQWFKERLYNLFQSTRLLNAMDGVYLKKLVWTFQ